MDIESHTLYHQIGGAEVLDKIVTLFYSKVSKHPELIPIFPEDLTETARKQKQFLTQFLGGPPLYSEEHGHPALRARHMPFEITPKRAKAWLSCMEDTLNEIQLSDSVRDQIFSRLTYTAYHMVNQMDDEG